MVTEQQITNTPFLLYYSSCSHIIRGKLKYSKHQITTGNINPQPPHKRKTESVTQSYSFSRLQLVVNIARRARLVA